MVDGLDIDRFANAEDVLKPKPGGRQGEEVAPGGNGGGGGGVENAINPGREVLALFLHRKGGWALALISVF